MGTNLNSIINTLCDIDDCNAYLEECKEDGDTEGYEDQFFRKQMLVHELKKKLRKFGISAKDLAG